MEEINGASSNYVYTYTKSHSGRWNEKYDRMTMVLEQEDVLENAEASEYISSDRNLYYMQNYYDELDEYYNYIEKTLLEEQSQKRCNIRI